MQTKTKNPASIPTKNYANERTGLKYCDKKNLSKESLSNIRIIKKNLVYIIGLSKEMANKNVLGKKEYFGQYGTVLKVVVNTANGYKSNDNKESTYSAYITFSKSSEASIAILAVDGKVVNNNYVRATYGSTKFCTFYLKGKECTNKECLYLHTEANDHDDILERDDVNNRINFRQQHMQAMKIANVFNLEIRKKIVTAPEVLNAVLPPMSTIYQNPIVYDNDINHMEFEKFMREGKNMIAINSISNVNVKEKSTKSLQKSINSQSVEESKCKLASDLEETSRRKRFEDECLELSKQVSKSSVNNSNSESENDLPIKISEELIKVSYLSCFEEANLKSSISSTSSSSGAEIKDSRLYKSKSTSRFAFIDEESDEAGVEVPAFVTQIIDNSMNKSNLKLAKLLEKHVMKNLSEGSHFLNETHSQWVNFLHDKSRTEDL